MFKDIDCVTRYLHQLQKYLHVLGWGGVGWGGVTSHLMRSRDGDFHKIKAPVKKKKKIVRKAID